MTGTRAMVSQGLRMDGTWAVTKPRKCLCCGGSEVFHDHDTPRSRVMVCDECGALEVITKGASWWYHGARLPEQWPAAFLASVYKG